VHAARLPWTGRPERSLNDAVLEAIRRNLRRLRGPGVAAILPGDSGRARRRHVVEPSGPETRMVAVFFALLIGLEIKHYIGDYFLQPGWMLGGKGDLRRPGGYAHAAIHAALSFVVLVLCGTPLWLAAALFVAEFVVHYGLDYAKIHYSMGVHVDKEPRRFWALHGIDQLTHQLTYAAMIWIVLRVRGLA
jgi:hypothetical protein